VLSSSVFNCWIAAVSGRLKSDYRISAEITYNNFPWPDPNEKAESKISFAANRVLDSRSHFPDSPLSVLYSPLTMPPALVSAHRDLDREVLKAYGLKTNVSSERILEELFTRYAALIGIPALFDV